MSKKAGGFILAVSPDTIADNLRVSRKNSQKQSLAAARIMSGRNSVEFGGEKAGRVERGRRKRLTVANRQNPVSAAIKPAAIER
jgi:hypothetical protein